MCKGQMSQKFYVILVYWLWILYGIETFFGHKTTIDYRGEAPWVKQLWHKKEDIMDTFIVS